MEEAIIGGGCFWCIEALMQRLEGVEAVVSGYAGGSAPGKPTYKEVCSGLTGHAEVTKITFDPEQLSYEDLLMIFMTSHDPTTLNRQGGDVGTQYRSTIMYLNNAQHQTALKVVEKLKEYYSDPIVTVVEPLNIFYEAELYHQNYFNDNPDAGFCQAVIEPKVSKLRKMYADRLKKNA